MRKKLLFVVNDPAYFVSHRFDIGIDAKKAGYEVHVASHGGCPIEIFDAGLAYHKIKMPRKSRNPFVELYSLLSLVCLFRKISPDLVHLVTIKPYLYGGIAARLTGVPGVVSAVAGLGLMFSSGDFKYRLLRFFLYPFYRLAFCHKNQKIIFQNTDDRELLIKWGVVEKDKSVMIRGSGVDLRLCPYLPEPDGVPIVSFAARLLVDKGVEVFVDASRILRERGTVVRFWLIGKADPSNANTVSGAQLKQWEADGLVELLGFRQDIPSLFAQSNIVTLPSFYGEGLPKVLVEAAACGRAVITTDHPGCRDAIESDVTGLLIPIRKALALADAVEDLIENFGKRKCLGQAGRILAEREFAIEKIVDAHMRIYEDLLCKSEAMK